MDHVMALGSAAHCTNSLCLSMNTSTYSNKQLEIAAVRFDVLSVLISYNFIAWIIILYV